MARHRLKLPLPTGQLELLFTHIDEFSSDAVSAIGAVAHLVDLTDTSGHDLIVNTSPARRTATPFVVSTTGDI